MTTMMLYHCNETHVLGIEPGNPHSSNETFSVGPGQGVYNATSSRARYANSVAAPLYAHGQTRRGRQNTTHDQQPDNEPEQAQYAREDLCPSLVLRTRAAYGTHFDDKDLDKEGGIGGVRDGGVGARDADGDAAEQVAEAHRQAAPEERVACRKR
jgi:hypothetical protein